MEGFSHNADRGRSSRKVQVEEEQCCYDTTVHRYSGILLIDGQKLIHQVAKNVLVQLHHEVRTRLEEGASGTSNCEAAGRDWAPEQQWPRHKALTGLAEVSQLRCLAYTCTAYSDCVGE